MPANKPELEGSLKKMWVVPVNIPTTLEQQGHSRKVTETRLFRSPTCTCGGIHPGRVEPASRWSCSSSLDTFTQSFLHRAWLKTRGPERDSGSVLIVVAHVFMQRKLRWFGRPDGELFTDQLLPTPPRMWRRRTGGQLKTWATTIKTDRLLRTME